MYVSPQGNHPERERANCSNKEEISPVPTDRIYYLSQQRIHNKMSKALRGKYLHIVSVGVPLLGRIMPGTLSLYKPTDGDIS